MLETLVRIGKTERKVCESARREEMKLLSIGRTTREIHRIGKLTRKELLEILRIAMKNVKSRYCSSKD